MEVDSPTKKFSNFVNVYFEGDWDSFRSEVAEFVVDQQRLDSVCQDLFDCIDLYEIDQGKPVPNPLAVNIQVDQVPLQDAVNTFEKIVAGKEHRKVIGQKLGQIAVFVGIQLGKCMGQYAG